MAGRGRGRGGRGRGKGIPELLGLGRGDGGPPPQQPNAFLPPVDYPPLLYKPLPLSAGPEEQFLLIFKRDLQNTISKSPFFVKPISKKRDIERYSDCYHVVNNSMESQMKIMDESRFPKETKGKKRKKIALKNSKRKIENVDVEQKLKELENQEINENDEDDDEEEAKEGEGDDEQIADEDEDELEAELDEGTDYNSNYFDNGEAYLDDEDDKLDEGPTF